MVQWHPLSNTTQFQYNYSSLHRYVAFVNASVPGEFNIPPGKSLALIRTIPARAFVSIGPATPVMSLNGYKSSVRVYYTQWERGACGNMTIKYGYNLLSVCLYARGGLSGKRCRLSGIFPLAPVSPPSLVPLPSSPLPLPVSSGASRDTGASSEGHLRAQIYTVAAEQF